MGISGKKALDAKLLERNISRSSKSGYGRKKTKSQPSLAKLDWNQWATWHISYHCLQIARHAGVLQDFAQQSLRLLIEQASDSLSMHSKNERRCNLSPVLDPRPKRVWVKHHTNDICRPLRLGLSEKLREEPLSTLVGVENVPVTIHDNRREWFLPL